MLLKIVLNTKYNGKYIKQVDFFVLLENLIVPLFLLKIKIHISVKAISSLKFHICLANEHHHFFQNSV